MCNDSDVPFWASSEMDSESDSELSDGVSLIIVWT